jgi:small-conductance mechanosensitive channel
MESIASWLDGARRLFDIPLFAFGGSQVTPWTVAYVVALVVGLFYLSGWLRRIVAERLLGRSALDPGMRHAAGALTRYLVLLVGLLIILQTAGIDLTTLNVLAGAIGIGVGFGLQNVVSNFFSGLIIMFERPIKLGDRIVVDGIEGDVTEIGARSTTVLTNDNIVIIVPNSKFITENVVNWKYNDQKVRFRIPVSVAYGSDVRLVERALLDAAKAVDGVLDDPPPAVRLLAFGDSGLSFELRAWSTTLVHRRGRLVSALNFAIYEKFAEHGIEIPFPQRDLHLRSMDPRVLESISRKGEERDGKEVV